MTPEFLGLDEVLEVHRELVEVYGGSHGVRDLGLLQSALAMPQAGIGGKYFHADLFEMAAAHLFHIVANHPFLDGNKRTGAITSLQFLFLNDVEIRATGSAFERLILGVARGEVGKHQITEFFRKNAAVAGHR
jgi:death-on-curing protein